jgi:hypothetical protein
MRKVITGAFVSLDGVIQAPGGPKEDPTRDFRLFGRVSRSSGDQFCSNDKNAPQTVQDFCILELPLS